MTSYTVKGAAVKVRRSTRTIKRWLADGMPHRIELGLVLIRHEDLITELKQRNTANPTRDFDASQ